MHRNIVVPLAVAGIAGSVGTATAQSPRDIVARGLDAIGGEAAVRGLATLTTDFYSINFTLGQSELPASPPRASLAVGRLVTDWRAGRRYLSQETRAVTGAVARQRLVVAGNAGATGNLGQQVSMTAAAVALQQQLMRRMPHRLLLAALDNPAALSAAPSREFRGQMHDAVRMASADTATLYFDRASGILTVSEILTDDPILGDRITQTWYTRWQPVEGGARYPRQIDSFVNGQLAVHLINTTASAEVPADSLFAMPDSIATRPPQPAGPAPIAVRLVELGPGVWRAEGGSHHSLVVEQRDQLVLVEAPQTTQRVRAVLDSVRSRWPAKRIGIVAMTHHHWDHSGGIREVIAEGIPIATHELNATFVRQVAAARRTVAPDLQSQRRRTPMLRTFRDSLVIGSGEDLVVLYNQPTVHVEGILSAWVPRAGVLFTSDVVNPPAAGAPPAAGSAELVSLARSRGLAPRIYAGGHGPVVQWADIERAAR